MPEFFFSIKLQASACNFIKKETLTQVLSCEFCEIFKNTFFYRTSLVAVSVYIKFLRHCKSLHFYMFQVHYKYKDMKLYYKDNATTTTSSRKCEEEECIFMYFISKNKSTEKTCTTDNGRTKSLTASKILQDVTNSMTMICKCQISL